MGIKKNNDIVFIDKKANIIKIRATNTPDIIMLDYDVYEKYCKNFAWSVRKDTIPRITTTYNKGKTEIHMFIYKMKYAESVYFGLDIDHISGDRFDNRLCNLRAISHKSNMQNQRKNIVYKQNRCEFPYKDINGEKMVKQFFFKDYPSKEAAIRACQDYIDNEYYDYKEGLISTIEANRLLIELERSVKGLKNFLSNDAIENIVKGYTSCYKNEYSQYWQYGNRPVTLSIGKETLSCLPTNLSSREEILNYHYTKHKVFEKQGRYAVYIGSGNKSRKLISSKLMEKLEDKIVNYYLNTKKLAG